MSYPPTAISPLKLARILRGVSQDELVARVRRAGKSTDRGEVSRIERRLQPLTDRKARVFAQALGVEPAELKPDSRGPAGDDDEPEAFESAMAADSLTTERRLTE